MEELIFFGIIILFSIIDSIARGRKKRAGRTGPPTPAPEEWQWDEDEVESYDDAYEVEPEQPEPLPEYTSSRYESRGGVTRSPPPTPESRSSEAMIPADIWEEIAGLARGRLPQPEPPPPPPPPVQVEPVRARPVQTHRVHRSHAGYGTDPSTRARSEQDGLDPLRRTLSADAAAVRRQLTGHRRSALRQAVILHEVLGPPAAERPERFPR